MCKLTDGCLSRAFSILFFLFCISLGSFSASFRRLRRLSLKIFSLAFSVTHFCLIPFAGIFNIISWFNRNVSHSCATTTKVEDRIVQTVVVWCALYCASFIFYSLFTSSSPSHMRAALRRSSERIVALWWLFLVLLPLILLPLLPTFLLKQSFDVRESQQAKNRRVGKWKCSQTHLELEARSLQPAAAIFIFFLKRGNGFFHKYHNAY